MSQPPTTNRPILISMLSKASMESLNPENMSINSYDSDGKTSKFSLKRRRKALQLSVLELYRSGISSSGTSNSGDSSSPTTPSPTDPFLRWPIKISQLNRSRSSRAEFGALGSRAGYDTGILNANIVAQKAVVDQILDTKFQVITSESYISRIPLLATVVILYKGKACLLLLLRTSLALQHLRLQHKINVRDEPYSPTLYLYLSAITLYFHSNEPWRMLYYTLKSVDFITKMITQKKLFVDYVTVLVLAKVLMIFTVVSKGLTLPMLATTVATTQRLVDSLLAIGKKEIKILCATNKIPLRKTDSDPNATSSTKPIWLHPLSDNIPMYFETVALSIMMKGATGAFDDAWKELRRALRFLENNFVSNRGHKNKAVDRAVPLSDFPNSVSVDASTSLIPGTTSQNLIGIPRNGQSKEVMDSTDRFLVKRHPDKTIERSLSPPSTMNKPTINSLSSLPGDGDPILPSSSDAFLPSSLKFSQLFLLAVSGQWKDMAKSLGSQRLFGLTNTDSNTSTAMFVSTRLKKAMGAGWYLLAAQATLVCASDLLLSEEFTALVMPLTSYNLTLREEVDIEKVVKKTCKSLEFVSPGMAAIWFDGLCSMYFLRMNRLEEWSKPQGNSLYPSVADSIMDYGSQGLPASTFSGRSLGSLTNRSLAKPVSSSLNARDFINQMRKGPSVTAQSDSSHVAPTLGFRRAIRRSIRAVAGMEFFLSNSPFISPFCVIIVPLIVETAMLIYEECLRAIEINNRSQSSPTVPVRQTLDTRDIAVVCDMAERSVKILTVVAQHWPVLEVSRDVWSGRLLSLHGLYNISNALFRRALNVSVTRNMVLNEALCQMSRARYQPSESLLLRELSLAIASTTFRDYEYQNEEFLCSRELERIKQSKHQIADISSLVYDPVFSLYWRRGYRRILKSLYDSFLVYRLTHFTQYFVICFMFYILIFYVLKAIVV